MLSVFLHSNCRREQSMTYTVAILVLCVFSFFTLIFSFIFVYLKGSFLYHISKGTAKGRFFSLGGLTQPTQIYHVLVKKTSFSTLQMGGFKGNCRLLSPGQEPLLLTVGSGYCSHSLCPLGVVVYLVWSGNGHIHSSGLMVVEQHT